MRIDRLLILVAAAATIGAVSAAQVVTPRTGLVMGQVVDGSSGKPIPEAIVSIAGGRGGEAATAPAGRAGNPAAPPPPMRVQADSQGRFLFRDLSEGLVMLTATKPGYFGGASGQTSPRGQGRPIELAATERLGGVTLRLWTYGAISGTVFDESGSPVTGVTVQLFKRSAQNGRWQFSTYGALVLTDDRGVFRVGSVLPGDYVVAARSAGVAVERQLLSVIASDEVTAMRMLPKLVERGEESIVIDSSVKTFPTTLFPGTTEAAQATIISVESGVERGRVDFRVKAVQVRKVSGRVLSALDLSGRSVNLRLRRADSNPWDADFDPPSTQMDPQGRYTFNAVPVGRYILEATSRPQGGPAAGERGGAPPGMSSAQSPAPEMPALYGALPVTVEAQDISQLEVTVLPSGRVTGRVEFDGSDRPTDDVLNQIYVTLEPADGTSSGAIRRGRVETDGTFRTSSVPPGRYFLRVGSLSIPWTGAAPGARPATVGAGAISGGGIPGQPRVWRPRSATINGRDPLEQPLDIDAGDITSVLVTFTDKTSAVLSGSVRNPKNEPDPQAAVLVFSTDSRLWNDFTGASRRIRLTRASRYGLYSVAGLAAGEYFVAVGTDEQFADMQAPGALDSYVRLATRVVLTDAETKALDLKSGIK